MQPAGGQIGRDVRPTEGPAAAQRQVEPQPELLALFGRVAEQPEKLRRAERAGRRLQRINKGNLDPAQPGRGDHSQLPVDFGPLDGRPEPPPAQHRPGLRRRIGEPTTQFVQRHAWTVCGFRGRAPVLAGCGQRVGR